MQTKNTGQYQAENAKKRLLFLDSQFGAVLADVQPEKMVELAGGYF